MKQIHIFLLLIAFCVACAVNHEQQHKASLDTNSSPVENLIDTLAVDNAALDSLDKETTIDTLASKIALAADGLVASPTTMLSETVSETMQVDSLQVDSTKNERLSSPVDYQAADSIVVDLGSEEMHMYNESKVHYEDLEINAFYIKAEIPKNIIYSKYGLDTAGAEIGFPLFKDKQEEYEVREMSYNIKTKKGLVKDILTKEGEGYIRSAISKRVSEDTFYLKDGRYTTCDDHDHPHYYISLKKAKMIKDDKVATGLANLVIEGVKTPLALPFGIFPLKKHYSSGVIIPSFGEEKVRGFFFRDFGYYWAINDYFDLRFNGSIFTNGSWESRINSSYRKRYRYNGRLNLSYSINKWGDKGLDDYRRVKDFAIRWTHSQDSKAHPYRTLSASVNISSSENDYRNSRSINNIVRNRKQSSISYSRRWPDSPFNLSIALQHSQNKQDTTINLTLPNVSFSMQTQYPFRPKSRAGKLKWYDMISMGYSARLTNSIHTHEDKLLKSKIRRDWKNGFQHNIPIGASYKVARDLTFSANINYTGVAYLNSIRKSYDIVKDKIVKDTIDGFYYAQNFNTSASLAFTPKFFGMYNFKKGGKIQAIRHVLSPSISLGYSPELGLKNDKYYRYYSEKTSDEEVRYNILENGPYGIPERGSKSGNISFSLDNNIEMKVRNDNDSTSNDEFKKIKLLESFRISSSYNIFRDSLNFSNISLSGRTSLFKNKVNINMSGTIDPYALDEKGTRINKYAGGLGRLVAAGFSLGTSFTGGGEKNSPKNQNNIDEEVIGGDEVFGDRRDVETFNDIEEYVNFDIPWSIRLDYDFRYSKPRDKVTTSQYLRLNGDFSLTKKWKISVNTGYDISKKEVTATSFSIFRDLHCWEMNFTAIPFGARQSYSFRIAVKSSLLKDLKLQKRDSWLDNF